MTWYSDFKRDVAKYSPRGGFSLKAVLVEQGLWALLQYRIESAVYRSHMPGFFKRPLRLALIVTHKFVEILTEISLPCEAQIGPGLHLPHCGFRIVHSGSVIGSDCCLSQGATIGASGRGDKRGIPRIGNRVYIATNAVIAGQIVVGDDSVIAANSLVTRDVPEGCTAMGVPAVVAKHNGSADYLTQNLLPSGKRTRPLRRLLVIARVDHYQYNGRFYSYTPYARELDVWADIFAEVVIVGTLHQGPPPPDCSPFTRSNIRVTGIAQAGGDGFWAKVWQLFVLPKIICQLATCIVRADVVHVRCPCDLGVLGLLLAPLGSDQLIAKYATQWLPYKGEPWSWRLQRWLLRSWWWHGPVTVYGNWPGQPGKVTPFFTSMLTDAQIERARVAAGRAKDPSVFRVLFVGRLSVSKNVDILCKALAGLELAGRKLACTIVGEGPQRADLEWQVGELGLENAVKFAGGLDFDEVLKQYEQADVLVLVSNIEGWPKAIAEGMAFGLVCIGTEKGMMPQMLGEGRGLLVPPRDVPALTKALQFVVDHPEEVAAMAMRAAEWSQRYSLDGLRRALRELMEKSWGSSCFRDPNEPRLATPRPEKKHALVSQ